MSKVLVVLICYLLAFNFAAKTEKEGEGESDEGNDEKRDENEENNPELLKPLVLIVENANLNEVFNVHPGKSRGVPLDKTKMQETDVYSNQLPFNQHKFYLCPQPGVKNVLGQSHNDFKFVHNCLFVTKFDSDEPKKCKEQPKGVAVIYPKNRNPIDQPKSTRLGKFAVKFCYPAIKKNDTTKCYRGGIKKFFTKPIPVSEVVIKRNYLNLYHFGYNGEEERTEWTIQTVIPISTLWSLTLQPNENTLSKSGHDVLVNSFDSLIKAYNAQEKNKPYWLAHRLAQPTKNPFNIVMSATSEIINTAPLQNKLQPLIYLIEERIQRLSNHISKPLKVMTKPLYDRFDEGVGELYLDDNKKFLIPNVWIKQVFDEATNTGIVIIVHNYPEYVPFEGLLCEQKASCQFQKWERESSRFKDTFDETLIKVAYCCKKAKFPMMTNLNIKNVIDINFDFKN